MKTKNYRNHWNKSEFKNSFAATSVVSRECEIKNSRLGKYSRIKLFCEVRSSFVGDYSVVSSFCIINATDIGKFSSIGPGVFIGLWEHNQWVTTHNFYLNELNGRFVKGFQDFEKDDVRTKIGNDVWVGANAVILKGKTIGDGAIIGAGAIVTKDVPPYAVAVGNPAKIIRYRFGSKDRAYLLKLKWWNLSSGILKRMVSANVWDSIRKVRAFCKSKGINL